MIREEYIGILETENAEVKKQLECLEKHLEVPKTCSLKTLEDYKSYYEDTTREQILEDTYIEYCAYVNLTHKYGELKKCLEEKNKIGVADHKYASKCEDKVVVMDAKQKKFEKYLEDELKRINPNELTVRELVDSELDNVEFTQYLTYKEVLQKYKKIVNGSERI